MKVARRECRPDLLDRGPGVCWGLVFLHVKRPCRLTGGPFFSSRLYTYESRSCSWVVVPIKLLAKLKIVFNKPKAFVKISVFFSVGTTSPKVQLIIVTIKKITTTPLLKATSPIVGAHITTRIVSIS